MIKTAISVYLECLTDHEIHHSLFISNQKCELHLWDQHRLEATLKWLEAIGVTMDSIIKMDEDKDNFFYIIKF